MNGNDKVFCIDEGKEINSFESLEPSQVSEIENLEKKLKYKSFINGNTITSADVVAYQNYLNLNIELPKDKFPKIITWLNEIKRLERNWKLSKRTHRKENGETFSEYVDIINKKISSHNLVYDSKMKEMRQFSDKLNGNQPSKEKEITTINFFAKKEKEYDIQILIKFLPNNELSTNNIASKLAIISHNHFPNKCNIEPSINNKGEISAIIQSTIDNENYDIEPLANEIKRNINGVYNISIQSIEKKSN